MLKLTQAFALSTIVAALVSAAPAIGYANDDGDRLAPRREGPTGLVIRRDGASAVPVAGYVNEDGDRLAPRREGPTGLVIRRDGASAVPVAPAPVQADDKVADGGFDFGDAAVGAGIVACLLAVGGLALVALRRPSTARTLTS